MFANKALELKNGYVYVMLPASLTQGVCDDLLAAIADAMTHKYHKIVLDFTFSPYLYSSGIGFLIRIRKCILAEKGSVYIVNIDQKCRSILSTVHLDSVFPLFATDVEFEISQADLWESKSTSSNASFLCTQITENGLCRINLCGNMNAENNVAKLEEIVPLEKISWYLFDMSSVDIIDSHGIGQFISLIHRISEAGGRCIAFGMTTIVAEMFDLLSESAPLTLCANEAMAIKLTRE